MAIHDYAFTDLDEVKDYIGITGSTHDTLLTALINAATDFIESYIGRRITEQAITEELHDGDGSDSILLKQYPIDSGETITLEQASNPNVNDSNFSTLSSSLYFVDYNTGIITTNFTLQQGIRNYRVSYTSGYADADVPFDIKWAAWELVSNMFNTRKAAGTTSQTLGDLSASFTREIDNDPKIKSILVKYVAFR